jgi:predicted DNA-binding antitoxin AbrB/MazE fold protein
MDDMDEAQIRAHRDVELNEGARHNVHVDEDEDYEALRRSRRDVDENDYEAQCDGRDLDHEDDYKNPVKNFEVSIYGSDSK